MRELLSYFAEHPELTLFLLVGVGSVVGHISVRRVSLGAAAVLFCAIALAASASAVGVKLEIPAMVGHLGLALFTFTIGISSGAAFFNSLRTSAVAMLGVALAIGVGAVAAFGLGPVFGLTRAQAAGTFAGALTNTPALAAAGNDPDAVVGYSVAYIFGVIGMLVVDMVALRRRHEDADTPAPLIQRDVRIEHIRPITVGDFEAEHDNRISVTRVRRTEQSPVEPALATVGLESDQVVTVVGQEPDVEAVIRELGHVSSHHLAYDRANLDFRRVTVSSPEVSGKRIGDLDVEERFGATVSRVRRADIDMVAAPDLVLQLGDRVRVVAHRSRMRAVTRFFGDSSRGLTILNPVALGLGVALGFALGSIPLPLPTGGTFTLGSALGCLVVGLLFSRIGRVAGVGLSLPFTVTAVLSEIGLLLFLAQAGTRAGTTILGAFSSGRWIGMFGLGAVITLAVGISLYVFMRRVVRMGGTTLAGVVAGAQTQPALLAYANNVTNHDFRVSTGYTMAYPMAMITKILLASVLGLLG